MAQLYMDECVHGAITRGLLRRRIDVITAQEDGFAEATDEDIIRRATELKRVVFTNDPDLIAISNRFLKDGVPFSGFILGAQQLSIGKTVNELTIVAECSETDEWADRIAYVPL